MKRNVALIPFFKKKQKCTLIVVTNLLWMYILLYMGSLHWETYRDILKYIFISSQEVFELFLSHNNNKKDHIAFTFEDNEDIYSLILKSLLTKKTSIRNLEHNGIVQSVLIWLNHSVSRDLVKHYSGVFVRVILDENII